MLYYVVVLNLGLHTTRSLAVDGPVSCAAALEAGVALAVAAETAAAASTAKAPTATETFAFQMELLHGQLEKKYNKNKKTFDRNRAADDKVIDEFFE